MANPFAEGVMVGEEQNKRNPFSLILGTFQEAQARRMKEDQERKKEEFELSKALEVLNKDYLYKQELEKVKAEDERKTGLLSGLSKGEITETEETGPGVFEGTPFGMVGKKYKSQPALKERREIRLAENQDLARASQLRKEFIDRPEVKDFVTVRGKVKSMDALLNKAVTNDKQSRLALDQGLITMFNKITDPQSVVRESEYERTPKNLSLANRFAGAVDKLQKGGAGLTNEDRKSLVWGAKIIVNEQGKVFNERISQYSNIAGAYNVDPELVVSGIEPYQDFGFEESGEQSNKRGGKLMIDAKGNKAMVYPDGSFEEVQ